LFLILFFLASSSIFSQKKDIIKIAKKISEGEYADAQKELDEYKNENGEDAAYLYFLVKNKIAQPIQKTELKNCIALLQESQRTFFSITDGDREFFCNKIEFCESSSSNSIRDVTKMYWNAIRVDRDLEEITQFLKDFPNQDFQSEIIQLRDELAYSSIQNSSNEIDFKNYITKYPNSAFKNKAQQRLEELAYTSAVSKNTIGEFKVFIQLYPNSPFVSKAQESILDLEWKAAKESNDLTILKQFVSEHPNCLYSVECKRLIASGEWRLLSASEDADALEAWALKNSLYPESNLANAKARELRDFVLPYVTKNRTYRFYYVVDKKIDENNEYQQVSRLDNGNFVVMQNNFIGMVDRKGKVIISPQYLQFEKTQNNFLVFGNNKYQILGPDGAVIKDLNYKFISTLYQNNNEFSIVWNLVNGIKKCGIINSSGKEIIPVQYDNIEQIKNGFLLYTKGKPKNLCDLVRFDGTLIISKIETAYSSTEGYYVFERSDKSGVVSSNGKILVQPIYNNITIEEPNQFLVYTDNNQKSIIDSTGNELLRSGNYNYVQHFSEGIYGVGDWVNFNLFDAKTGRYFGSSGYESGNFYGVPNFLILRKGKELEIIESKTRKSIKKLTLEDHTPEEEEYYGEEGDGGDGYEISETPFEEFDDYFKPEFSVPTTAYLTNTFETTLAYSITKYENFYELGNYILIDKITGDVLRIYPNYNYISIINNNVIGIKQNENDLLKLVDSNNKIIKESVAWAYGISDNEIVYTVDEGNLKKSYSLMTTTNKSKEIGVDISNFIRLDNYCRYTYKDIQIYELADGTKLFDNNIEFKQYESNQLISKASTNYYNRNYSEAIRLYQESLKLTPNNFSVYLNISNCYRDNSQYNDALTWINKAISEDPQYNEYYYTTRIGIYEKQGNQYGMAVDYYTIAQKSNYSSIYNYCQSAYYYLQANYQYDVIRVADEALSKNKSTQKDSNIAMLYNNRGCASLNLGLYSQALPDFNNALKFTIESNKEHRAMISDNLGITYLNLKNNAMACKYFKQACALGNCSNTWRCR
jgi:outer membrane protein assembly factor BamD (BamD/ComL family)